MVRIQFRVVRGRDGPLSGGRLLRFEQLPRLATLCSSTRHHAGDEHGRPFFELSGEEVREASCDMGGDRPPRAGRWVSRSEGIRSTRLSLKSDLAGSLLHVTFQPNRLCACAANNHGRRLCLSSHYMQAMHGAHRTFDRFVSAPKLLSAVTVAASSRREFIAPAGNVLLHVGTPKIKRAADCSKEACPCRLLQGG